MGSPVWGSADLRPDGLAGGGYAGCGAPVGGEGRHEEQTTAGLGVRRRGGEGGNPLGAGVGDLDTDGCGVGVRVDGEAEMEVPAGDMAVAYGVRGELGGEEGDGVVGGRVVGMAPLVETVRDEAPGESCAAWGGSETHVELLGGGIGFVRGLGGVSCGLHAANGGVA